MASVVDTSVKHFHSGMSGMPIVNGLPGSYIGLLDALLKDGVDLKTAASLTVAGGVATLAFSGSHSAQEDAVIVVAGSSVAALNGEQKVTSAAPGVVKFATAAADGVASGTITFKMAPLGWEKPFSGPNKGVYRSLDPMSTRMFFRMDDAAGAVARVLGYESMSDVDTGVGPFPSSMQIAGGGYWGRSVAASAAAVQWFLIGDSRGFYLHTIPNPGATSLNGHTKSFGDAAVIKPGGDPFACFLSYSINATAAQGFDGQPEYGNLFLHAAPRSFLGVGQAVLHTCYPYTGNTSAISGMDPFFGPLPSQIDGRVRLARRFFAAASSNPPRADAVGIRSVPHNNAYDSLKFGDRVPGSEEDAGRRFFVVNSAGASMQQASSVNNCGVTLFDLTGPWVR